MADCDGPALRPCDTLSAGKCRARPILGGLSSGPKAGPDWTFCNSGCYAGSWDETAVLASGLLALVTPILSLFAP